MSNSQYIFSLIFFGSFLLVLFVFAITSFVFIHRQKTVRQQLEMNDVLLKARIEAQEQALKSLSFDIHDKTGQSLAVARMLLTTAIHKTGNQASLVKAAELLAEGIDGLRTLAYTLNAEVVGEHGLIAAIQKEVEYVSSIYKLNCRFLYSPEDDFEYFNDKEKLFVFRIIQEALQNIIKHAGATYVLIKAEKEDGVFRMSIRDNGIGIPSTEDVKKGVGLIGMGERATLLGANLEIQPLPTRGSEILLTKRI